MHLNVDVSGRSECFVFLNTRTVQILLTQTLTPRVYFDNAVPIQTTIPVREVLKINKNMPINTKVQVGLKGRISLYL